MPHQPEQKDWVVHSDLQFAGETIAMFADSAEAPLSNNPNIHISLNYDNLAKMEKAFAQLAEGRESHHAVRKTILERYLWYFDR